MRRHQNFRVQIPTGEAYQLNGGITPHSQTALMAETTGTPTGGTRLVTNRTEELPWRPWQLRLSTIVPSAVFFLGLVVFIEGLRWYINEHIHGIAITSTSRYIHFTWAIPPVALAAAITLLVDAITFKAERLMPWFSMAEGAMRPDSSICLDYPDWLLIEVPFGAFIRKHWLVCACSIVSLVGVGLSTVSAPLMYLGPTLHESQASFANSNASVPGLVSGVNTLESFYAAMIDASSVVRNGGAYSIASSAWTLPSEGWSVGPFQVDADIEAAAARSVNEQHQSSPNMTAVLPAIQHTASCETAVPKSIVDNGNFSYTVEAQSSHGCVHTTTFTLDQCCDAQGEGCCNKSGGDLDPCGHTQNNGLPLVASQQSVVFWTARLTSLDLANLPDVNITICTPSYILYPNATVLIDVPSKTILQVTTPVAIPNPPPQVDPSFNGSTFNGFDLTYFSPDGTPGEVSDRKIAIRTGLLSAISPTWPYSPSLNDSYTSIVSKAYLTYLTLVGREVYFRSRLPSDDPPTGTVLFHTPEMRLFVNDLAAHLTSVVLFIMVVGLTTAAWHLWRLRDKYVPQFEGRIATSTIAAQGISEATLLSSLDGNGLFRTRDGFLDPRIPRIIESTAAGSDVNTRRRTRH